MKQIGVGIIGAGAERGWARASHIPALARLEEYEIRALSTARLESAQRAARELGVQLAFGDYRELLQRPEVDLAVIAVNVVHHHEIATAAIAAGKMVLCEWPLGRNLQEALDLAQRARQARVRTAIGLQGRFAPAVRYARQLVREGYVGEVLGTTMQGCGPDDLWAGVLDPPYEVTADNSNGSTLLAIVAGHALEQLAFVLGEFVDVSARLAILRKQAVRTRDQVRIAVTSPDQVAIAGVLESGALASIHFHGGPLSPPQFSWQINGSEGQLVLRAERGYANMSELTLLGARNAEPLRAMATPSPYVLAPAGLSQAAVNVASLYRQLALDLVSGSAETPDFEAAVRRHRVLDAIERADAEGRRERLLA